MTFSIVPRESGLMAAGSFEVSISGIRFSLHPPDPDNCHKNCVFQRVLKERRFQAWQIFTFYASSAFIELGEYSLKHLEFLVGVRKVLQSMLPTDLRNSHLLPSYFD